MFFNPHIIFMVLDSIYNVSKAIYLISNALMSTIALHKPLLVTSRNRTVNNNVKNEGTTHA